MKIYKNAVRSRLKNKKIIVRNNPIANGVQIDIVGLYDEKLVASGPTIIEIDDDKFVCNNSLCVTREVFDELYEVMTVYKNSHI